MIHLKHSIGLQALSVIGIVAVVLAAACPTMADDEKIDYKIYAGSQCVAIADGYHFTDLAQVTPFVRYTGTGEVLAVSGAGEDSGFSIGFNCPIDRDTNYPNISTDIWIYASEPKQVQCDLLWRNPTGNEDVHSLPWSGWCGVDSQGYKICRFGKANVTVPPFAHVSLTCRVPVASDRSNDQSGIYQYLIGASK